MMPDLPGDGDAVGPTARRVRASTKLSVPSLSMNASVRWSGLRATPFRRSPSPCTAPIAAGLLSSAASRFARVCGESSSATAWRASNSDRSRSSSTQRPRAQALGLRRGRLGAGVAALVERDHTRDDRQREQHGEAGDQRPQPALRALARRSARGHEIALGRGELGGGGRPVEHRGQPRAAVQLARVAPVPRARAASRRCRCRRRPCASSSSQPRSRGHSRSSASCATSTSPSAIVTRRSPASTSTIVARRARPAATRTARLAVTREPQQDPARHRALLGLEPLVRALGEPRHRAVHATGVLVGGQAQVAPVAVLPQLEQRGREQRQRAGPPADVREQRVDELEARPPGRRAARATRWRGAARRGASARRARGRRRAAARVRGTARSGRRNRRGWRPPRAGRAASAAANARRSSSSSQAREQLLELIDDDAAVPSASSSARIGCAPGRSTAIVQRSLPGSTPAASAGEQPRSQRGRLAAPGRPDDAQPAERR